MAGPYWLVYKTTGATLGTQPYVIGRSMLILWTVLPLVIYFLALASLAERFGTTDWGRLFMMAGTAFGTFLTTYAVSINNHVLGAASAAVALWAYVQIVDGRRKLRYFVLAGLAGAFTAANELPALAFLALLAAALLYLAPKPTLAAFLPAALVIVAAHFGTNYLAHGTLREPYSHWNDWYMYSYEINGKVRESYWKNPQGIDAGEPDLGKYVLHTTVGHHGIFSLTPLWLLSLAGLGMWLARPDRRWLAAGIAMLVDRRLHVLSHAAANPSQLRRHDQWAAVDVLVCPALARRAAARGRLVLESPLAARPGAGADRPVGPVGQLSDLESLDASVDSQLPAGSRLGVAVDGADDSATCKPKASHAGGSGASTVTGSRVIGMGKAQPPGMQGDRPEPLVGVLFAERELRAVMGVAEDRVPARGGLDANLMGPAGFEPNFQPRALRMLAQRAVVQHGFLPAGMGGVDD